MKRLALALTLCVGFAATAFGQQAMFHVFPQFADGRFADGTYYRSTIMIMPWFTSDAPVCTLRLNGMTSALEGSIAGSLFSINIQTGGFYAGRTPGTQAFQQGYATLTCSQYVYAQVLYSFYAANGAKLSEATVFSAQKSYYNTARMVADYRDGAQLGVAIANDTDLAKVFTLVFGAQMASVSVPARSSKSFFLDQLIPVASGQAGLLTVQESNFDYFYVMGLRFTGTAFTTIPSNN